jgi:predicted nucleic acid-binding protein
MTDRRFFDSNVLVYAYDSSEPVKQNVAQGLLREGLLARDAIISAQTLSEFFVTECDVGGHEPWPRLRRRCG